MKNADQLLTEFHDLISNEKKIDIRDDATKDLTLQGGTLDDLIHDFNTLLDSDDDGSINYDKLEAWNKSLPIYKKPSIDASPDEILAWNKQVCKAWRIIKDHPIFDTAEMGFLQPEYLIDPTLEDGTGQINDDDSLNTKLRYWYEILLPFIVDLNDPLIHLTYGDKPPKSELMHVWVLDGGADSYDEAIMQIYAKIIAIYGEPVYS